jgi:pantothenate kinase
MEAAAPAPAGRAVTDLRLLYTGARGSEWRARAGVHAATASLSEVGVTGLTVPISPIDAEDVENTLLPLALWLAQQCAGRQRVLVGVTGAGGAGKSVACEVLAACLRALPVDCYGDPEPDDSDSDEEEEDDEEDEEEPPPIGNYGVVVLGVDAFHYPNAYLLENEATLHSGQRASLKAMKGTPPTMDIAGLRQTLETLLEGGGTQQLPYYDRQAHDPRPTGSIVMPETRLVLVEGIHLLHAEGAWAELRPVRKNAPSFEPFYAKNDRVTKTGAGQT